VAVWQINEENTLSQFVLKSETERESLDWGSLGWMTHPPLTGNRQLTVLDVELLPGNGHDFHRHPDQEETIYVIEGSVEQWVDQEMKILGPGDTAYIDAGVVHASFNTGDKPAKVLAILGPCVGEIGYATEPVHEQAPWDTLRA
jgi:quercetin dioxygenase-like cupin family protein